MANGEQKALIVVDVQNDFCPGGSLPVAHGDEVVAPLNELIEEFLIGVSRFSRLAIGIQPRPNTSPLMEVSGQFIAYRERAAQSFIPT